MALVMTMDGAKAGQDPRRAWARPGGVHDHIVALAGRILPVGVLVLVLLMAIAPMRDRGQFSFMLAKDAVQRAPERMRINEAIYRGADQAGRPFSLHAGSAVQATSRIPVVDMRDLSARIALADGPAQMRAPVAEYLLNTKQVRVNGPLLLDSANGYRLIARDVMVDLQRKALTSHKAVDGSLPIGRFSGNRMTADMDSRTVVLEGNARLHIERRTAR